MTDPFADEISANLERAEQSFVLPSSWRWEAIATLLLPGHIM